VRGFGGGYGGGCGEFRRVIRWYVGVD